MKDLGHTVPTWKVLRMSVNRMISMKDTCPEDTQKTLTRHAKDMYGRTRARKHDIKELEEGVCGSNQSTHHWKERIITHGQRGRQHKRCLGLLVELGRKKRLYDMSWTAKIASAAKSKMPEGTDYIIAGSGKRNGT